MSLFYAKQLIPKDLMPDNPQSPAVVVFEDLRAFTVMMPVIDAGVMKHVVAVRGDYQLEHIRSIKDIPAHFKKTEEYLKKREEIVARMKNLPKDSPAPQWEEGCQGWRDRKPPVY